MRLVLDGALGKAGRYHKEAFARLGVQIDQSCDISLQNSGLEAALCSMLASGVSPDEIIVDICTPTASHCETMLLGYKMGVRRFIVEKPAASSEHEWNSLISTFDNTYTRIYTIHNYLYSRAFSALLQYQKRSNLKPVEFVLVFNKDRRKDSANGRGMALGGNLPTVFQIEVPHALSLGAGLIGKLSVENSSWRPMILEDRTCIPRHGVGEIFLSGPHKEKVNISSSLQAKFSRHACVKFEDNSIVTIDFGKSNSVVMLSSPNNSRQEVIYKGVDDMLAYTLKDAIVTLENSAPIPHFASTGFTRDILHLIDVASRLAESQVQTSKINVF